MTDFQKMRREIVCEVLDKFPNISTRAASIILYRDYPLLFNSQNHARMTVQYLRGEMGEENRKALKDKKYVRKPI